MSTKFRKPPYFRFNVSDYLSSMWVQRMTAEQRGWYIMLLCRCWDSDNCMLPNDDHMHVYAGADPKRFAKHGWIVIQRFNTTEDGKYLFNKRLMDEYEEILAHRMNLSEKGREAVSRRKDRQALNPLESVNTSRSTPSEVVASFTKTETETEIRTTTPPTPSKEGKQKRKKFSLLEFHPDTKDVVNELIPLWPEKRKDGSRVVIDTPRFAARVSELLRNPELNKSILIGAATRYISNKPDFPKCPQYFFGPGVGNSDPFWLGYAVFERTQVNGAS